MGDLVDFADLPVLVGAFETEGAPLGYCDGSKEGTSLGGSEGSEEGALESDGAMLGLSLGAHVGSSVLLADLQDLKMLVQE